MQKIYLIPVLILILASSCTIDPCMTKGQFINGYETFTDKISDKHDDYSKSDWEEHDEQMDQFVDVCYKKFEEKLTDEEKKDFWIKYFKYKYDRHGRNVLKAIEKDVENFTIEMDKELTNLFDNPEQDLKELFKEVYGDDIEQAIDDFKRGIDDLTDKIKEWLKEDK